MATTLDKAVPWGRTFDEYVRMFDLSPADLNLSILDCAAGPAAFTAEMHSRGHATVACDPIYQFSAADIARRVEETRQAILKMTYKTRDRFVWREIESIEHLGRIRMGAMKQFLSDLPRGISKGRYSVAELPALPFRDRAFSLALCSHFLFVYSDLFTSAFHLDSIREMCRVAGEARIFPLLPSFGSERSPHVEPVVRDLRTAGYRCEIKKVPYEFLKGGNEMLRVSR